MLGIEVNLGLDFWNVERKLAGKQLDVLRGQNIPSNARTIDRTVGGSTVVSHKSTDLRYKSYRSASTVYGLGTSFVRSLKAYKGETRRDNKIKATFHLEWAVASPDAVRILEWFVPLDGITEQQEHSLQRVVEYGQRHGVVVSIMRVP